MLKRLLRRLAVTTGARSLLMRFHHLRNLGAVRHVRPRTKLLLAALLNVRERRTYAVDSVRVRLGPQDLETVEEIFGREVYGAPMAREPLRILDLGANVGLFTAYAAARFPSASIVAVEPDPSAAAAVRRMLDANDLQDRVTLLEAAATTAAGTAAFEPAGQGGAISDTGSLTVPTVDAIPLLAQADVAKIDIEGGEWQLLLDDRFGDCAPPTLLLEYHRYLCPERDPDFLRPDPNPRRLATEVLERAGYVVHHAVGSYWGHGIVWAQRG